jgi:hypothetical protein
MSMVPVEGCPQQEMMALTAQAAMVSEMEDCKAYRQDHDRSSVLEQYPQHQAHSDLCCLEVHYWAEHFFGVACRLHIAGRAFYPWTISSSAK